jgi:hypothetical protein
MRLVIKVAKGPGETGARRMSLDTRLGVNPNYTRPFTFLLLRHRQRLIGCREVMKSLLFDRMNSYCSS